MDVHLTSFLADLRGVIDSAHPPCRRYTLTSRMKTMSSATSKLRSRPVKDFLGCRIVYGPTDYGKAAYYIAQAVSERYDGSLITRDYIATPKRPTRYQSIHMQVPYLWYEIELQIRDEEMDRRASNDSYHLNLK